jgi:hypothetical protein
VPRFTSYFAFDFIERHLPPLLVDALLALKFFRLLLTLALVQLLLDLVDLLLGPDLFLLQVVLQLV